MKFGIQLPQAGVMFAGIKDPVQAYETMTHAAQLADECGYETVWLADLYADRPASVSAGRGYGF